jgi:hypothetical protein
MSSAPPDDPILGRLRWPWSAIADAMLRYAEARQRVQAAQVRGDADALCVAELDLADATADFHKTREQLADLWLTGFRAALDLNPYAVGVLLDRLPVQPVVAEAIDELQDAVLDLEQAAEVAL